MITKILLPGEDFLPAQRDLVGLPFRALLCGLRSEGCQVCGLRQQPQQGDCRQHDTKVSFPFSPEQGLFFKRLPSSHLSSEKGSILATDLSLSRRNQDKFQV